MRREQEPYYKPQTPEGTGRALLWYAISAGAMSALAITIGRAAENETNPNLPEPVTQAASMKNLTGEFRIESLIKKQDLSDQKISTPTPIPTPEPVPETTVTPVQAQAQEPAAPEIAELSAEGLKDLICGYPWPCEEALRVKWCESGDSWHKVSNGNYGGFQINQVHAARFPDFWESWMDPVKNTSWAYEIWSEQGWKPWGCRP